MNLSSIKTPGVYINEIDAFPPSVAQVATAIPAFVGYTEKGPPEPVRITSFMEFSQIFGGAPSPTSITVVLDENNLPTNASNVAESKFQLYGSLKLFYENGGGVCYIVSIGNYSASDVITPIVEGDFYNDNPKKGIKLLENEDEPTLILFPDAINLDAATLGNLQKQALLQCENLMDRFVILDVLQKEGLVKDSENFRDAVGSMNLKYGAAYYPYLQTNMSRNFRFLDIQGNGIDFKVNYPNLATDIDDFKTLNKNNKDLNALWNTMNADKTKPNDAIEDTNDVADYVTKSWNLLGLLNDLTNITNDDLKAYFVENINLGLKPLAQNLFDLETKFKTIDNTYDLIMTAALDDSFSDAVWKNIAKTDFEEGSPNNYEKKLTLNPETGDDEASFPKINGELNKLHSMILSSINATLQKAFDYELKIENDLVSQFPIFPLIVNKLNQSMNTVPPSGAIAGIYAQTDRTRGVWKSPANISINGIIGLTDDINDAEQQDMNIHETGKSINAIRKFTGKGFLVWGGRTLAGNSNDWRYINIRRLANMIEESAKKACMQFVFEPNSAQTWVNVKGMIDNYLNSLWNDGALVGAKAEHAFFVQIGLGQTMSSQDILEGKMIVKIGYAPSRPAEFIILEFKQMQQRS